MPGPATTSHPGSARWTRPTACTSSPRRPTGGTQAGPDRSVLANEPFCARASALSATTTDEKSSVICVLGDAPLDVVVSARWPVAEETDTPARTAVGVGGQAANVAAWVVALGGEARRIAARGTALAARLVAAELERRGVDLVGPVLGGRTGVVVSLTDHGAGRSMLTDRGIGPSLSAGALRPEWLDGCAWLHLPAYSLVAEPVAGAALAAAERAPRLSVDLSWPGPSSWLSWARAAFGPAVRCSPRCPPGRWTRPGRATRLPPATSWAASNSDCRRRRGRWRRWGRCHDVLAGAGRGGCRGAAGRPAGRGAGDHPGFARLLRRAGAHRSPRSRGAGARGRGGTGHHRHRRRHRAGRARRRRPRALRRAWLGCAQGGCPRHRRLHGAGRTRGHDRGRHARGLPRARHQVPRHRRHRRRAPRVRPDRGHIG